MADKAETKSQEQVIKKSSVYAVRHLTYDIVYLLQPLEKVEFYGLEFLSGIYVKKGLWCSGTRAYIPVNQIADILEFDSLEDYENSVKDNKKPDKSKAPGFFKKLWSHSPSNS